MTSPANPQPTPPAGYEILSPEVAKMKPEGMLCRFNRPVQGDGWQLWGNEPPDQGHLEIYVFSAPLGTTALLLTPGPEAGECDCKPKVHLGHDVDCNCTACEIQRHPHTFRCSAHPRNAYVKVLPGWVDALPNGCPKELLWANKGKSDWTRYNEPGRKIVDTVAAHHQFAYAVPRHVFDALNRPDPEVAKMDESKLQGELQPDNEANAAFLEADRNEQEAELWVVKWRSRITGFTGQGEPMSKPNAEAWARKGNLDDIHRTLTHWIEPANTRTPPPVDGSGPTDTEMLDWVEEKYQPGHNFTKLGLWFLQRALGRETEPLRAAIAQAMQSK